MGKKMTELLTSAQMRAVERAAIESGAVTGAVTGLTLMERAGAGVVGAILTRWPGLAANAQPPGSGGPRAVVLCGPGNNGGDGFVIARLLHLRGWSVRVLAATSADKMPAAAAVNARLWGDLGPVGELTAAALQSALQSGAPDGIYIDAVFGTGLTRPPEGEIHKVLALMGRDPGQYQPRLVAVDAPSGLCLDSGRSLMAGTDQPRAALTVTFHSLKPGHLLAEGPEFCGEVVSVDIGLDPWRAPPDKVTLGQVGPVTGDQGAGPLPPGDLLLQSLSKGHGIPGHAAHKFSHGHALILSGGAGRAGAARLSARAALRVGAGLVTLGSPPDAMAENAARLDAIMLRPVAPAADLSGLLADRRINALCIGPGLGLGAPQSALVATMLQSGRPLVLDADALTLIAGDPALFAALHDTCILTPHGGEFARLFPDLAEKLAAPALRGPAFSKVDATRTAAARAGCTVLLKGTDTVIATPEGQCAIHSAAYARAAPWLATAGSGDVLAGLITGLLARGRPAFDAACMAAWLHVEAARSFGPGLIAEDLPEELPKLFRTLGL